jgi:hypothetical protein
MCVATALHENTMQKSKLARAKKAPKKEKEWMIASLLSAPTHATMAT